MKINSWQDWQRFKKAKKDFAKKWKICLNLQWVIRKQIRKHCCILSGTWLTTFRLKNFSSKDFLSKKWKPVTTAEAPHAFWVWWSMTPFFSHVTVCKNHFEKSHLTMWPKQVTFTKKCVFAPKSCVLNIFCKLQNERCFWQQVFSFY